MTTCPITLDTPQVAAFCADPAAARDPAAVAGFTDWLQEQGVGLPQALVLYRGRPPGYEGGLPRECVAMMAEAARGAGWRERVMGARVEPAIPESHRRYLYEHHDDLATIGVGGWRFLDRLVPDMPLGPRPIQANCLCDRRFAPYRLTDDAAAVPRRVALVSMPPSKLAWQMDDGRLLASCTYWVGRCASCGRVYWTWDAATAGRHQKRAVLALFRGTEVRLEARTKPRKYPIGHLGTDLFPGLLWDLQDVAPPDCNRVHPLTGEGVARQCVDAAMLVPPEPGEPWDSLMAYQPLRPGDPICRDGNGKYRRAMPGELPDGTVTSVSPAGMPAVMWA